ncbi:MAG: PAS domain S-box protein, partial [Phycisphaerales bacterium]
ILPNATMFDWRQLKRWGIKESALPVGSIVHYKEQSIWELYRWYIIGSIIFMIFEGLVIFGLVFQRRRARKAEKKLHQYTRELKKSEQQLSLIYDSTADILFYIRVEPDDCFRFLLINDSFLKATGLTRDQIIGKRIEEVIPETSVQLVLDNYKKAIKEKRIVRWEETSVYPSGEKVGDVSIAPIFNEMGICTHLVGSVHDITESKQADQVLRSAEFRYRTVADFTYDWEYWRASDDRFLWVSPSCERITGYRTSDFIDQPELLESLIHSEDLAAWNAHRYDVKLRQVKGNLQFRIRSKDGKSRWIDHVCQPVYDEQGNHIGTRASNREITELKRTERELREYRNALALADRRAILGQLAGSIAHELNQPLTGILSNAQAGEMMLKQGGANSAQIEEIITDIIVDSKRAANVLRNLRELFSGQKLESAALNINTVIKETVQVLNSEFVMQNLNIHLDLSKPIPDVMGNKIQLQQVLINLIINAIQAMQQRKNTDRSISIITSRENESRIRVCVEDSGPGIDPERLEVIFEPLISKRPEGLGMG